MSCVYSAIESPLVAGMLTTDCGPLAGVIIEVVLGALFDAKSRATRRRDGGEDVLSALVLLGGDLIRGGEYGGGDG